MARQNTKKMKELFLSNYKKYSCNITATCTAIKIARKTFYLWIEKDKKFKERVDEINESLIDHVETKLLSKINSGDTTSIIFFLKTKGKNRGYIERVETENREVEDFTEVKIYIPDNGRD